MTISPIDLTTIAAARQQENIAPTVPDATIQSFITSWSRLFMTLTRRGMDLIAGQTTTEQRDGTGTDTMTTIHYPVIAPLTSLIIGLRHVPLAVYPSFGYVLDVNEEGLSSGFISLVGMRFCKGRGNVQIAYSYGWPAIPEDVGQAANTMALWLLRERDHVDLDMGLLAGQTTKWKEKFPHDVQCVIHKYTRKRRVS